MTIKRSEASWPRLMAAPPLLEPRSDAASCLAEMDGGQCEPPGLG